MKKLSTILLTLIFIITLTVNSRAREELSHPPVWEVALYSGMLLTSMGIEMFGHRENVTPTENKNTLDYRIAHHWKDDNYPLKITGDILAAGGNIGAILFYGTNIFLTSGNDRLYAENKLMSYYKGMSITMLTTSLIKISVRRNRPNGNDSASFISGHSSLSFYTATFISLDLGNYLFSDVFKNHSGFTRVTLSYILPSLGFYALAGLTAYSRVRNRFHYLTDVIAGAALGIVIGALAYHFFAPSKNYINNAEINAVYNNDIFKIGLKIPF